MASVTTVMLTALEVGCLCIVLRALADCTQGLGSIVAAIAADVDVEENVADKASVEGSNALTVTIAPTTLAKRMCFDTLN